MKEFKKNFKTIIVRVRIFQGKFGVVGPSETDKNLPRIIEFVLTLRKLQKKQKVLENRKSAKITVKL